MQIAMETAYQMAGKFPTVLTQLTVAMVMQILMEMA